MQSAHRSAPPAALPRWVPIAVALLLLLADQALKAWALANLTPGMPPREFIPGLISWTLVFNTGAAWSLFSGSALPLAIGRLLVGLGLLAYVTVKPQDRFTNVVLGVIAAGAIGNTIDGFRFGKVTDMIYSPALSAVTQALKAGDFPTFNLADSCVVVGVLLLLIAGFWPKRKAVE